MPPKKKVASLTSEWCIMTNVPKQVYEVPSANTKYTLLSSSLFFFPGLKKNFRAFQGRDDTHYKQRQFLDTAEFYLRLFESPAAQQNFRLRLYIDHSLALYKNEEGIKVWDAVLDRFAKCP